MAKIYDPPSNPYKRSITHGITAPHTNPIANGSNSDGTNKTSTAEGNPFSALGDPSLHQSFSGPFAGLAQYGQMKRQHEAFLQEQGNTKAAMQALQEKMSNGDSPQTALFNMLKENPGHLLNLPKDLIGFMQQAGNAMSAGQTSTFDMGNGNTIGMVMGPDGKPHYMNMPGPAAQNANTNRQRLDQPQVIPGAIGPNGGVGVRRGQDILEDPNLRPTSTVNAANKAANAPQGKYQFNSQYSSYMWVPNDPNQKPTRVPLESEPTVKLPNPDSSFFSVAPNLYNALSTLHDLSNTVPGPITGKIRTLSGKILGEDQAAIQWNTARTSAENSIASLGNAAGGYVAGMKERISNLPKDWQSGTQNNQIAKQTMDDLRNQTAMRAGALEGRGVLPEVTSEGLTKMGVFTKRFAPGLSALRTDPTTMTTDDLEQLAPYGPRLPKDERETLAKEITRRMQSQSNAAVGPQTQPQPQTQPLVPAPDANTANDDE